MPRHPCQPSHPGSGLRHPSYPKDMSALRLPSTDMTSSSSSSISLTPMITPDPVQRSWWERVFPCSRRELSDDALPPVINITRRASPPPPPSFIHRARVAPWDEGEPFESSTANRNYRHAETILTTDDRSPSPSHRSEQKRLRVDVHMHSCHSPWFGDEIKHLRRSPPPPLAPAPVAHRSVSKALQSGWFRELALPSAPAARERSLSNPLDAYSEHTFFRAQLREAAATAGDPLIQNTFLREDDDDEEGENGTLSRSLSPRPPRPPAGEGGSGGEAAASADAQTIFNYMRSTSAPPSPHKDG